MGCERVNSNINDVQNGGSDEGFNCGQRRKGTCDCLEGGAECKGG